MHVPAMSGWLLVVLCGVTGAYCLARMRCCRAGQRITAGGEALMGLGMAAMALPASPGWWPVYAAVFGAASLHAVWQARRGARHLHHLVGSLAMVYMAVAMAGAVGGMGGGAGAGTVPGAHAGHGGPGWAMPGGVWGAVSGGVPLVTGALVAYYCVYVLRTGARLVPVAAGAGGVTVRGEPGPARACRVSMGTAMLAMLLTL
ncbi:DUF5134 domain-containing protein [Streptomyces sp. NPDC006368]|uniref:DUF5134 domain-containing protein n=1 Tax=Streptomyces sp. NPDC006368 TaxID=3156760 RepID=UPI0033B7BFFF